MYRKIISSISILFVISTITETKAQIVGNVIRTEYTREETKEDSRKVIVLFDKEPWVGTTIEQMPQFPGGTKALFEYIKNNLKPIDSFVEGRVIVHFVIDRDSTVKDIQVLRSLSKEANAEAIRMVQSMPKWISGKNNGTDVPVYFTLPIAFELSKTEKNQKRTK